MGKVAANLEVKPDGPDVDLDRVLSDCETSLPEGTKIEDVQRAEVGFGIQKLVLLVMVPDDAGGADKVQSIFENIDGVQSVDINSVSRV